MTEGFDTEDGDHAKKVGKGNSTSRIDYKEFGRRFNNWLNDKATSSDRIAGNLDMGMRLHERIKTLESMASGYQTSPEAVREVAEYCGLEVPLTDKAKEKKSPFGRGRAAAGGDKKAATD
jgi:hypothetical protein